MQYLLILIISAFLTSCVSNGIPAKYMPQKNPQPKYFLTIKGHVAPSLIKTTKVTWILNYQTTNPKCESEINDLEGIWVSQEKRLRYVTRPNKHGDFIKKIPLDYYFPGQCDWGLDHLSFNFKGVQKSFLTYFGKSDSKFKSTGFIEFNCNEKNCRGVNGKSLVLNKDITPISNHLVFKFIVN